MGKSPSTPHDDQAKLDTLTEILCDRLDDLIARLGIDLRPAGKLYMGPCPVHGGDRADALNLYPTGETLRGNWRCNTRQCHGKWPPTLIGFVRGVLSHDKCGWPDRPGVYPWNKTLELCCEVAGQDWRSLKPDRELSDRKRFHSLVSTFVKQGSLPAGWDRGVARSWLRIPSRYYMERGYGAELLDRYDVGDALTENPAHPMYGRAVVPVYDEDYRRVVGITGRATCKDHSTCGKWRNNKGFECSQSLYNYWFAKRAIQKTKLVVIAEGPGDVWKLVEAGVENAVALYGNALDDYQSILLERSSAMSVASLLDRDPAGEAGTKDLQAKLGRLFRVTPVTFTGKDVGGMSAEEIRDVIVPQLKRLER